MYRDRYADRDNAYQDRFPSRQSDFRQKYQSRIQEENDDDTPQYNESLPSVSAGQQALCIDLVGISFLAQFRDRFQDRDTQYMDRYPRRESTYKDKYPGKC